MSELQFTRYAIFHTPPPGPLADFTAAWLGWDSQRGTVPTPPEIDLPLPLNKIAKSPRKYGFHGTLKPPFRLAPGQSENRLRDQLARFCEEQKPVALGAMAVGDFGGFLALTLQEPSDTLNRLAAAVVEQFDPFRATLSEAELARRRRSRLSPQQETHLQNWGYPFVMDQFRYHMTLTGGGLNPALRQQVLAALSPRLMPHLPDPYVIGDITLMGEALDGKFHQIARYPLGQTA